MKTVTYSTLVQSWNQPAIQSGYCDKRMSMEIIFAEYRSINMHRCHDKELSLNERVLEWCKETTRGCWREQ